MKLPVAMCAPRPCRLGAHRRGPRHLPDILGDQDLALTHPDRAGLIGRGVLGSA
jgi:hypothetical protein